MVIKYYLYVQFVAKAVINVIPFVTVQFITKCKWDDKKSFNYDKRI